MEHTVYEAQNPILISLGKLLAAHKVIVFGFGTAFKYLFVAHQGGTINSGGCGQVLMGESCSYTSLLIRSHFHFLITRKLKRLAKGNLFLVFLSFFLNGKKKGKGKALH